MNNTLVAAGFVVFARDCLERARTMLTGTAELNPDAARKRAQNAKNYIRLAREAWAKVQTMVAIGNADVSHHYCSRAWRSWCAEVCISGERGAWLYRSERRYAQRQSAQRAALRERGRMVRLAEDRYLSGEVAA
jgi:hypothetical protein